MNTREQIAALERVRTAVPLLVAEDNATFIAALTGLPLDVVRRLDLLQGVDVAAAAGREIEKLQEQRPKIRVRLPSSELWHYRLLKRIKAEYEKEIKSLREKGRVK